MMQSLPQKRTRSAKFRPLRSGLIAVLGMVVTGLLGQGISAGGTVTYTNENDFPALQPQFFNSFSGGGSGTSLVFSSNGLSYVISDGPFGVTGAQVTGLGDSVRTFQSGSGLVIDFSNSPTPIYALGGHFFFSGSSGTPKPIVDGTVTAQVTLADLSTASVNVSTTGGVVGFGGFTSAGAKITKLTLSSSAGIFTTIDDFSVGQVASPTIRFCLADGQLVLSWTNAGFSLQSAPVVDGVYTNVTGATSPCTNDISAMQRYFRLKGN